MFFYQKIFHNFPKKLNHIIFARFTFFNFFFVIKYIDWQNYPRSRTFMYIHVPMHRTFE
jgi:hypothetical protein